MKTLYLLRHATPAKIKSDQPDAEKALSKQGVKEARELAKKLAKHGASFDIILSSSAKRAVQTAEILAKALGLAPENIRVEPRMYEPFSELEHLRLLKTLPDDSNSVILVGHVPNLNRFAAYLIKDFTIDLPKCGLLSLELRRKSWKSIYKGLGLFNYVEWPVDKAWKPELVKLAKKQLQTALINDAANVFETTDVRAYGKVKKELKKACSELVDHFMKEVRFYRITSREDLQAFQQQDAAGQNQQIKDIEKGKGKKKKK